MQKTDSTIEARIDELLEQVASAEIDEERADVLTELADLLENHEGNRAGAREALRMVLDECPNREGIARRLADRLEAEGDDAELVAMLEAQLGRARRQARPLAEWAERLALARQCLGDIDGAIEAWQIVLAERPDYDRGWRAVAAIHGDAGRDSDRLDALGQLARSAATGEERAALHRQIAEECEQLGDRERAAEHLEYALADCDGSVNDYRRLASTYLSIGREHAAIDAYRRGSRMVSGEDRALVLLDAASVYEQLLGDLGNAVDVCNEALEASPEATSPLRVLLRLHRHRGDHEAAVATLERMAESEADPGERAALMARAGRVAARRLSDPSEAERLFQRAIAVDAGCVPAASALADMAAERGDLDEAVAVIELAYSNCQPGPHRAAIAGRAAAIHLLLGNGARAVELYRVAIDGSEDGDDLRDQLSELLWEMGEYQQLVDVMAGSADLSTDQRRRLAVACHEVGDSAAAARHAEVAIDQLADGHEHLAGLCQLVAGHAFDCGELARAQRAFARLLATSVAPSPETLYRAGMSFEHVGDRARAGELWAQALALDPNHQPALLALARASDHEPRTRLHLLGRVLAGPRTPDRVQLLIDYADLQVEVGNASAALDAYREALNEAPDDHLLAHKCIDILVAGGLWLEALSLIEQLIASEGDPVVRGKYHYTAAMVCASELELPNEAESHLWAAVQDDPGNREAGCELEELLRGRHATAELAQLHSLVLSRSTNRRGDEDTLRRWLDLADLCWAELGQPDAALDALEVAHKLAPQSLEHLATLAERATRAGGAHRPRAMELHYQLLARDHQRHSSYRDLADLYRAAGQSGHAHACQRALSVLSGEPSDAPADGGPRGGERSLSQEMWSRLGHPSEDATTSCAMAILAGPLAARAAISLKRLRLELGGAIELPADSLAGRTLTEVSAALGVVAPLALAQPDSRQPIQLRIASTKQGNRPVLILGKPLLSGTPKARIAFHLGRALASLRGGGILRYLFARPEAIARLLRAAIDMFTDERGTRTWNEERHLLESILDSDARARLEPIARRLAERSELAETLARSWLQGHDLSIARLGLIACGDLATSLTVLASDPPSAGQLAGRDRAIELIWSSVTKDVLEARAHLEAWSSGAELASREVV